MKLHLLLAVSFAVSLLLGIDSTDAYRLGDNDRWTNTATNGSGLVQGDPTTLTWSIVPDDTDVYNEPANSNLVSFLNTEFGSSATWMPLFEQSFQRWDDLSGLTLVHEPNDDGVRLVTNAGVLGVRGDVRIGGINIDGSSGTLAYNYFPNSGDMVIDTADGNLYENPANNYRYLRNVIMHEHGHGIGMDHVESNNSKQLLEPFLNTSFDGPQWDDLLAAQRGYGDIYEENGGNDTAGTAHSLGTIASGFTASIGTDAANSTVVSDTAVDFVSVDDNSDVDFYSFTVDSPSSLDITLDPRGPTYNEGPQGGSQSSYNTRALSNLTLQLVDTNGTTILATANSAAAGSAESISSFAVGAAGTYYVRASGSNNDVQMYQLDVTATSATAPGDFDGNGDFACADIDELVVAVASGSSDMQYDLDGSTAVDVGDVTEWRALAGAAENASGNPYLPGDANLNGLVDFADFTIWNANKFTSNPSWCSGDFNANGLIDFADFTIWNANKFQSSNATAAGLDSAGLDGQHGVTAVPEPVSATMLLLCLAFVGRQRRAQAN